jgi:hypothetical protein
MPGGGGRKICDGQLRAARRPLNFESRGFEHKVAAIPRDQEANMPGPAPTPNVIRMLRGNPCKRRLRPEIQPPRDPEPPAPPAYLAGDARDEWVRIAPMLHALGVLRATDHTVLAAYCSSR